MAPLVKRMCLRKRRHESKEEAAEAVAHSRASMPLRTYRCPHCAGWHLTKEKKR